MATATPAANTLDREYTFTEKRAALCITQEYRENGEWWHHHARSMHHRGWLTVATGAAMFRGTPDQLQRTADQIPLCHRSEMAANNFCLCFQHIPSTRIEFVRYSEKSWTDIEKRRKPRLHTITKHHQTFRAEFTTPSGKTVAIQERFFRTVEKQARALKIQSFHAVQETVESAVFFLDSATGEPFAVVMPLR